MIVDVLFERYHAYPIPYDVTRYLQMFLTAMYNIYYLDGLHRHIHLCGKTAKTEILNQKVSTSTSPQDSKLLEVKNTLDENGCLCYNDEYMMPEIGIDRCGNGSWLFQHAACRSLE